MQLLKVYHIFLHGNITLLTVMKTIQHKTCQHQLIIFSTIATKHSYGRLLQIKHEGPHKFHKICKRGKLQSFSGRGEGGCTPS